jgi:hypothetical protein
LGGLGEASLWNKIKLAFLICIQLTANRLPNPQYYQKPSLGNILDQLVIRRFGPPLDAEHAVEIAHNFAVGVADWYAANNLECKSAITGDFCEQAPATDRGPKTRDGLAGDEGDE